MEEADLLAKNQYENAPDNMSTAKPTLKDLGVEHKESQRWQRIAAIPEDEFEEKIANARKGYFYLTKNSPANIAKYIPIIKGTMTLYIIPERRPTFSDRCLTDSDISERVEV